MTKVLILDDDADRASGWVAGIKNTLSDLEVEAISKASAAQNVEVLLERQREVRDQGVSTKDESIFDSVDILVVDYDLVHISHGHGRFTGEGICRLAHAYSGCGLIVVLNQFVEADFDLSQRGNPSSSHADLNVSANHIANKGLWVDHDWEDFRPWHWPILPDAAARHTTFGDLLSANPEAKLLELLGFTANLAEQLSDDAVGFIDPESRTIDDLMNVTVSGFLKNNSHATDPRDGAALTDHEVPYRFSLIASRVSKWMKRMVVGPRNLLIDLPHLVERYPFLLPEEQLKCPETWDQLTNGLPDWFKGVLPEHVFADSDLWSRVQHVWLPLLEAEKEFQEKRYDFVYSGVPEWVFAEDHSHFLPEVDAKMFKAEFNNEFDKRFVKDIAGINYAPKRRFAI